MLCRRHWISTMATSWALNDGWVVVKGISIPITAHGQWDQQWLMWGRVRKQPGHRVQYHTHWNTLSRFLTLIIRAFGLASQCEWTKSTARHLFSLADWIMVMETEHLISILYGCRYQMSHTGWKRKSTFPLICKRGAPICRDRPDHVFCPGVAKTKTCLETRERC